MGTRIPTSNLREVSQKRCLIMGEMVGLTRRNFEGSKEGFTSFEVVSYLFLVEIEGPPPRVTPPLWLPLKFCIPLKST